MTVSKSLRFVVATLIVFLVNLATGPSARAHLMPLENGTINITGQDAYLVLATPVSAYESFRDDGDGRASVVELAQQNEALKAEALRRIVITAQGREAPVGLVMVMSPQTGDEANAPTDYVLVLLKIAFAEEPKDIKLRFDLFGTNASGKQITIKATRGEVVEARVLTADRPEARYFSGPVTTFFDYLVTGGEHILFGYDHLLFVLTLLGFGAYAGRWVLLTLCFTAAHSITLVLAAQGLLNVPASLVEPAIAVSIILVALDNLIFGAKRSGHLRAMTAFACGLIHGLGFASALGEIGLDPTNNVISLVGFNLGIELGQLLVLGVMALCVWGAAKLLASKNKHNRMRTVGYAASVIAILLAVGMLADRVTGEAKAQESVIVSKNAPILFLLLNRANV